MTNTRIIINFVLFQLSWFACVIGAAKQIPLLGVIVVLFCTVWHLANSRNTTSEMILLLVAVTIGGIFDQLMNSSGLVTYQSHGWNSNIVPVWILALWLAFTTTLNVSLRWLRGRTGTSVLFGLIGGPLAYSGAIKLGAITFNNPQISIIALAVGWAILTPLLIQISQKFDGFKF